MGLQSLRALETLCSFTVPAALLSSDLEPLSQSQLLANMWPDGFANGVFRGAWSAPVLQVTQTQQAVRL